MNAIRLLIFAFAAGLLAACGTPSWDVAHDGDDPDRPASLIEVQFGPSGETEVTKNLPADAAHGVGRAVKSIRGTAPADVAGE